MEKWERLEDFINGLIEKIVSLFTGKAVSLTPEKIKSKLDQGKEGLNQRKKNLSKKVKSTKDEAIAKALQAKDKVDHAKVAAVGLVAQAKKTKVSDLKPAKIFAVVAAFLTPPLLKLKTWYLNLKPTQIVGVVTFSTVAAISSVNIYVQSNKIAKESRSPASELVEEVDKATAISRRPAYFKKTEKQFKVANIVLPAYHQKGGAVRKLVIDFTFESSNKYIKEYLWSNPHLIQDTLNSKIEPISLTFPLENEGKDIIKEKIKAEMNNLLKEMKIKGTIKDVYIDSMIAG